jgi:hypothetical protein
VTPEKAIKLAANDLLRCVNRTVFFLFSFYSFLSFFPFFLSFLSFLSFFLFVVVERYPLCVCVCVCVCVRACV